MFQSLLSWKYNQILNNNTGKGGYQPSFNPFYLWNTIRSWWPHFCTKTILFQSLLSWKYNQIHVSAGVNWAELAKSFNPCYLGNTIRSILFWLNIEPFCSSFNPCYLGNTIRSIYALAFALYAWSFNPCYLGNTIRSNAPTPALLALRQFQSLLSWKYNQISKARPAWKAWKAVSILVILEIQSDQVFMKHPEVRGWGFNPCYLGNTIRSGLFFFFGYSIIKFQSLLSWKYNQIFYLSSFVWQIKVKFQSLLSWKYNQICIFEMRIFEYHLSFNPCYLGNTIRSPKNKEQKKTTSMFQSLLSWKYNQIPLKASTNSSGV